MDQAPTTSPIEVAAANLRGIWAAMLSRFGLFGVEPARQVVTAKWCSAIFRRIDGLLARYRAGKLRSYVTKRAVAPGRKIVNKSAFRMPRSWGWLVVTGKHHAAGYGSQVQHVLSRPEMVELLETSEQAKRILRPLCRALAIELPWAVDKPRAERPRQPRQPRKPRKPRPKPEPFKIPLPRGMLSAGRKYEALDAAIKLKHELVLKMAKTRLR